MANAFGSTTVTSTAEKILSADPKRKGFILDNSSTVTVFLGFNNTVTATGSTKGISLRADSTLTNAALDENYRGDVFAITASSNATVEKWDWQQ